MISFYFFLYVFLSQFPSVINVGSSYIGFQILILPLFYLKFLKVRRLINYALPITILSFSIGFLKYFRFNILELILRFVGIFTIIVSLLVPIIIYNHSKNILYFKKKYIQPLIYLTLPNLVFCLLELVYRFNGSLYSSLVNIKALIFVPNRSTQVVGTISGLFPEHGLFAPFLLFIIGLSFWILNNIRLNALSIISSVWIIVSLFHSSGLYFVSLFISLIIFITLFLISLISNLSISKKSLRIFSIISIMLVGIFFIGQYTHTFLYTRFSNIFANFDLSLIAIIDKSLGYKLLPYIVLFKTSFLELLIGSGSGSFSQLVITKSALMPEFLQNNVYFIQNLKVERFALNSLFICTLLEYGVILGLIFMLLLRKYIRLFRPIKLFVDYSNILRYKFSFNELVSIFFFMACFISALGAVPLTYPFSFISLSLMFIIFENKKKGV
ncbi:MAG: hypothetical protein CMG00_00135 [Candidatus Marinimicrobia bacterium]|nr:hypothetical protein [Candidatus Neomarinimicrobiota bacterium]|tara:strand:+ start:686 stop:2008 length:1323 start_codon:yes stop_codon:yes gene_type:complete